MATAGEIQDLKERLATIEMLLEIPGAEKWKESKVLMPLWFKTSADAARGLEDVREKHNKLTTLLEDDRAKSSLPAEKAAVQKELDDLRKEGPAKDEYEAHKDYKKLAGEEERAGKDATKLKELAKRFAKLAEKYPDTEAGKKAKEAAKRLG